MRTSKLLMLTLVALFSLSAIAQNPKVVNGVATYHSNKTIGQKFMVPDSWNVIVIKANVTVKGNFVTPDTRKKDLTVRGENWNTSVITGTGNVMSYPDNKDNRRYLSAISNNGQGTLFVENLKSFNPDKFHLRSEGRIIVKKCKIIQEAGIEKGHADGVHGGRRSKSEIHDSFISTWDDATYSSECWLIKNTTIELNGNGAAFQVGYGNNYVHDDFTCRVINCTVIANGTKYSKGVVAWTQNKYTGGPNHSKIHFENFTLKTNPGKKPLVMYTMGGNSGKTVGNNCEIHVTSDNSICGLTSNEFRSNSPGTIRLKDCGKYIDRNGVHNTNTGGNVTITFGTTRAVCTGKGKAKNIVQFTVKGTTKVPTISAGSLKNDGGGKYRIVHTGVAFGSTTTYKVTVAGKSASKKVKAVSSCNKSAEMNSLNSQVSIYPNPATSLLNIELADANENASVKIYSTAGQLMVSQLLISSMESISLENLTKGMYLVQIQANNETVVKNLIVE